MISRILLAVAASLVTPSAFACAGGVFEGVLANPAGRTAPVETTFAVEIARLAGEPEFRFVETGDTDPFAEALRATLARAGLAEADASKQVAAYADYRRAVRAKTAGAHTPADLPAAFRLYESGADAWRTHLAAKTDDPAKAETALRAAEANWGQLLALPESERRDLAVPTRFMLAQAALARPGNPGARAAVEALRTEVRAGAPDRAGLAAASYQLDRHLAADPWEVIEALMRIHAAGGPEWQTRELKQRLRALLREPAPDAEQARLHPQARAAVAALIVSQPVYDSREPNPHETRWIEFVENAVVHPVESPLLAAAAYRLGDYQGAERRLAHASPDDPLAALIAARLHLRRGKTAQAVDALARVVPKSGPYYRSDRNAERSLSERTLSVTGYLPLQGYDRNEILQAPDIAAAFTDDYSWEGDGITRAVLHDELALRATAAGELAALLLNTGDPARALDLFMGAALWRDAARVAELHLDTDRLIALVNARPAAPEITAQDQDAATRRPDPEAYLRYVLGRRLCREGRFDEAKPYFPRELRPALDRYVTTMRAGFDLSRTDRERAESMLAAARLLETDGEAIFLSVTGPRIRGGEIENIDFEENPKPFYLRDKRIGTPFPVAKLPLLRDRVMRIRAFELAMHALSLLPNDDAFAAETYARLGRHQTENRDHARASLCLEALRVRFPRTPQGEHALRTGRLPEVVRKPDSAPY